MKYLVIAIVVVGLFFGGAYYGKNSTRFDFSKSNIERRVGDVVEPITEKVNPVINSGIHRIERLVKR